VQIIQNSADDLLLEVFKRLFKSGLEAQASKGHILELTGVQLELRNPRARLSRTETRSILFSSLGELFWYLSGSQSLSFIRHYIEKYPEETPDSDTLQAAYGPRLAPHGSMSLLYRIVELLKEKPTSRRAVIPIYSVSDVVIDHPEIPCTCTLQFLIRRNRLLMIVYMRSNDAFKGLPSDIFAFTMIQEMLARALEVEVGSYKHFVGSLHLYEEHFQAAEGFLSEAVQKTHIMPLMPREDPFPSINIVVKAEKAIREGGPIPRSPYLSAYWKDIIRLLQIHSAAKDGKEGRVRYLREQMHSNQFAPYIEKRRKQAKMRGKAVQLSLPTGSD